MVAKAEHLDKGENPRFVVTSLTAEQWAAQDLYEKFYCARGEMENRIKEQMCLFADRLSTDEMKGNQLRLYFSALAYTLMEALRRLGLKGTAWAEAQVDTIRLKLLKIGAIVRVSVRRIAAPDEFSLPLERYLRPSLPRPALLSVPVAHTNSHSAPMHNPFPSILHRGRSYTQTRSPGYPDFAPAVPNHRQTHNCTAKSLRHTSPAPPTPHIMTACEKLRLDVGSVNGGLVIPSLPASFALRLGLGGMSEQRGGFYI